MGVLASVIVRQTSVEARDSFYGMFEVTGVDVLREKLNDAIKLRTASLQDFNTFEAPDLRRQGWLDSLRKGQLPSLESLRLEGHLYAGITAWAPLDISGRGSSAAYFVGSGADVAGQIRDYQKLVHLNTLVLSGWPLIEEAKHTAAWLLPELDCEA